jgi:hypothetical protein
LFLQDAPQIVRAFDESINRALHVGRSSDQIKLCATKHKVAIFKPVFDLERGYASNPDNPRLGMIRRTTINFVRLASHHLIPSID